MKWIHVWRLKVVYKCARELTQSIAKCTRHAIELWISVSTHMNCFYFTYLLVSTIRVTKGWMWLCARNSKWFMSENAIVKKRTIFHFDAFQEEEEAKKNNANNKRYLSIGHFCPDQQQIEWYSNEFQLKQSHCKFSVEFILFNHL